MSRIARSYAYLLAGFPLAVAAFVVAVTGLSVGAGTLVVWIGLPVLVATPAAARGFAGAERVLVRAAGRCRRTTTPTRAGAGSGGCCPGWATRSPGAICCTPSSRSRCTWPRSSSP